MKYDTILAEWLMENTESYGFDEEIGDSSDGPGWAGRCDALGVILREDMDGAVTTITCSEDNLTMAWADIVHELEPSEEPEEDDYVISPKLHVTPLMRTYSSLESALLAIHEDMGRSEFYPNVWLQDDHGGFSNITSDLPTEPSA